jgi:DNA-binding NarL/FixJ family response regulator
MNKVRILLADDHPGFTDRVEDLLDSAFDIVDKVKNGEALVALALLLRPDIIITDISMPILNGIDAVRKLQQLGSRAKIIFLTVHSDRDFVLACIEAGGTGYVLKSRLANDLIPALREVLGGRMFPSTPAGRTN